MQIRIDPSFQGIGVVELEDFIYRNGLAWIPGAFSATGRLFQRIKVSELKDYIYRDGLV